MQQDYIANKNEGIVLYNIIATVTVQCVIP